MSVRSALYYRRGVGGKVAIEDMAVSTGKRLFVKDTTGTDGAAYGITPDKPLATIDYAIGLCSANKGDIIYVMEGHTETIAATIAADVAGIQIVGLGRGTLRPKVTGLTGVANLTVSAAKVTVRNIHFLGVTGTTYLASITGASPIFEDCIFEAVAVPVKLMRFGIGGGDDAIIRNCKFCSAVNGPDYAIDFASSSGDRWSVESCKFEFAVAGLDNAAIAARVRAPVGFVIKDCVFMGMDSYLVDFASSSGAIPHGLMTGCRGYLSATGTSIEDCMAAAHVKGLAVADNLVTDDKTKYAGRTASTVVSAS